MTELTVSFSESIYKSQGHNGRTGSPVHSGAPRQGEAVVRRCAVLTNPSDFVILPVTARGYTAVAGTATEEGKETLHVLGLCA